MTRRLISVLVTSLLLISSGAWAQTPPANTGTTGPIDLNWQFSLNGGADWINAFQVNDPILFGGSGGIPPNWEPNTAAYSWISVNPTASGGTGSYLFRTLFDLTGFNPGTAVLSFLCAVDNVPPNDQYSLNGGPLTGSCGYQSMTHFNDFFTGPQVLSSGFNGGSNELRFQFTGDGRTDGLLVGNMSLTATAIPEPESLVLLGTGLVGVFGVAARRRRGA